MDVSEQTSGQTKRPLHLWIVGALSLLWNMGGAADYTMTKTRNAAYLADFTPEQLAYFDSFSVWMNTAWAVGVWGALAGSLLLLTKPRLALPVFMISLVGLAVSTAGQIGADKPAGLDSPGITLFNIAIWVVALGLVVYAWWVRKR